MVKKKEYVSLLCVDDAGDLPTKTRRINKGIIYNVVLETGFGMTQGGNFYRIGRNWYREDRFKVRGYFDA